MDRAPVIMQARECISPQRLAPGQESEETLMSDHSKGIEKSNFSEVTLYNNYGKLAETCGKSMPEYQNIYIRLTTQVLAPGHEG